MEGKVKVTVEFLDQPDQPPLVLEYAGAHIVQERGLMPIFHTPADSWIGKVDYVPNGHRRACIKLWSGCPTYEEFKERGT